MYPSTTDLCCPPDKSLRTLSQSSPHVRQSPPHDAFPRYVAAVQRLFDRTNVTEEVVIRSERLRLRRRQLAVSLIAAVLPKADRDRFDQQLRRAHEALEITEIHGPLMHPVYMHQLRRLVLAQGSKLGTRLPDPADILHLSLAELECPETIDAWEVVERRRLYEMTCAAPLPPPVLLVDDLDDSTATVAATTATTAVEGTGCTTASWFGVPAAPGRVSGRLVRLSRPSEIDRVEAGDIALVPDAGAVWGWLGLSVGALLVEDGGWLGHAATAARELGIPCVVDCTGLTAVVGEGRTVHVNGQTGVVTW